MENQALFTGIIVILMAIGLVTEKIKPSLIVFSALFLLILGNVITIDEAFAGFSNTGMLTVGFLFIISAALKSSGLVKKIINILLGEHKVKSFNRYIRLMFPVAFFSAFLNNTPIVASLIHVIKKWSRRTNIPASKFLIPLSYAALLGGICTLIGTSTNLVIHGLLLSNGYKGFSFFQLSLVGVPTAILGIVFVASLGKKFLPRRRELINKLDETTREFVAGVIVGENYPHIGDTIKQAGLRHLKGLFLFQIIRDDRIITPVTPHEKIQEDDRLFFTGLPETIYELQKISGLKIVKKPHFNVSDVDSNKLKTYEAVVSNVSPLIGKTVRESQFRKKYNAVILAIHRSGERINKKVGNIKLRFGDTLFILARRGFGRRWYNSNDFSLVTSSINIHTKPSWKSNTALVILLGMVLFAAFNIVPIIIAAAGAAILMLLLNIISLQEAQNSVDWPILVIIASSLGIGKAVENSGLAFVIADNLIEPLNVFGSIGIIAGLYVLTSLCTWLIQNNAVAALMFPVALTIAKSNGLPMEPVFITLAMAASSSFVSPIGYQTNLMVYSAGGYKIKDFMRIGIPMNIFIGVVVTILVYLLYL
ncbi:MAG: anion permease [Candidatus Cloacimonetes bacterium]|nr:anion permease [Candidatus Cloacimonadota bacterium]